MIRADDLKNMGIKNTNVEELEAKINDGIMKTIEEQKQSARNTNELLDHLMKLIESNDDRFSFEWLVGGEKAVMEIYDKEKDIGYAVKIEPIEYDENGDPVNL